jgi:hypothetical protein
MSLEFPRLCRGGSNSLTIPAVVPHASTEETLNVSRQAQRSRCQADSDKFESRRRRSSANACARHRATREHPANSEHQRRQAAYSIALAFSFGAQIGTIRTRHAICHALSSKIHNQKYQNHDAARGRAVMLGCSACA